MSQRHERGVALITAMLIVSLATLIASALFWESHLDRRRTENLLYSDQALQYALGAEAWAHDILRQDLAESSSDHLGEPWAVALPPLPIDGGYIEGLIEDMQGRFNINNLIDADGVIDERSQRQLERLLELLELEPRIAAAVADWVDTDLEPSFPDGVEDGVYTGREPAYRAPNLPVTSASELLAIEGIDRDAYALLKPFVTALPVGTQINVNTAPSLVLQSLGPTISPNEAEALVQEAQEIGFEDLGAFTGIVPPEQLDRMAVASRFFRISVRVTLGTTLFTMYSLLERDEQGHVWTLTRHFATE